MPIQRGTLVLIELRNRRLWGVVESCDACCTDGLKSILALGPQVKPQVIDWIYQEADNHFVDRGEMLKLALPRVVDYTAKPEHTDTSSNKSRTPFSDDQLQAIRALATSNGVGLLLGATGSGKTEVYFELVRSALSRGQVLVLLPEISLTKEWIARFRSYFGFKPYAWHSRTSKSQKTRAWHWAASGQPGVVVGARSAVFLPLNNLALVVIDEEHDQSYKQEVSPRYHARDVAVHRAQSCGAQLILVSATPSVETMYKVLQKKYVCAQITRLPKHGLAAFHTNQPSIGLPISNELLQRIRDEKERGGILLLANRRGYASCASCVSCKRRLVCSRCTVSLAWHNSGLKCHWCGLQRQFPTACACGSKHWRPYGWGLERIYDWLKEQDSDLRIGYASSDTNNVFDVLDKLRSGLLDVVVGTQIISQGHNLPNISLVAMIDTPSAVDFRAYERLFHLINQTRGRAGRGDTPGMAWWETENTNNHVAKYLDDHQKFYQVELRNRQIADMPPFSELTAIIVSSKSNKDARNAAAEICKIPHNNLTLWGPAPAPVLKIRNTYRWRVLIRGSGADFARQAKALGTRHVAIDIDPNPYSFY